MAERTADDRRSIIEAVRTPLGFFTLGVLVCEGIMAVVLFKVQSTNQTILIVGMIGTLLFLFAVVGFITFVRPQVLEFGRGEAVSDEIKVLLPSLRAFRSRSEAIVGTWSVAGQQLNEAGEKVTESAATCTITSNGLQVTIEGAWKNPNNEQIGSWIAENVFVGEHAMTYVWEVPERVGSTPTGVARLIFSRLPNTKYVNEMKGTWGVVGRGEFGTLEFKRATNEG